MISPMFINLNIGLKGYIPLQDHQSASPRRLIRRMAVRMVKRKSSLRREKVEWADRAGSGPTVWVGKE